MGACPVLTGGGPRARDRLPPQESGCAKRFAAQSIDNDFVSKLRMAFREQLGKGEGRDPLEKKGTPCSSALVESYFAFVAEE